MKNWVWFWDFPLPGATCELKWTQERILQTIFTANVGVINILAGFCYEKLAILFLAGNMSQHCKAVLDRFRTFRITNSKAISHIHKPGVFVGLNILTFSYHICLHRVEVLKLTGISIKFLVTLVSRSGVGNLWPTGGLRLDPHLSLGWARKMAAKKNGYRGKRPLRWAGNAPPTCPRPKKMNFFFKKICRRKNGGGAAMVMGAAMPPQPVPGLKSFNFLNGHWKKWLPLWRWVGAMLHMWISSVLPTNSTNNSERKKLL